MKKKGEVYGLKFREEALERIRRGERVARVAKDLGCHRSLLYQWRSKAEPWASEPPGREDAAGQEIRQLKMRVGQLERLLGQEMAEKDFFESALRRIAVQRGTSSASGSKSSELKSAAGWERKAN